MALMVWCNSCKTVVWAYDHEPACDLRGIFNHMRMPCGKCGAEGNFDGWGGLAGLDGWETMRRIASERELFWDPSPTGRWFLAEKEVR